MEGIKDEESRIEGIKDDQDASDDITVAKSNITTKTIKAEMYINHEHYSKASYRSRRCQAHTPC